MPHSIEFRDLFKRIWIFAKNMHEDLSNKSSQKLLNKLI